MITDQEYGDPRVEALLHELDMAVRVQEIGPSGVKRKEILDVHAIYRAGAVRIRIPGRDPAVRIGARYPLIAIRFIGPGVPGDPALQLDHRHAQVAEAAQRCQQRQLVGADLEPRGLVAGPVGPHLLNGPVNRR